EIPVGGDGPVVAARAGDPPDQPPDPCSRIASIPLTEGPAGDGLQPTKAEGGPGEPVEGLRQWPVARFGVRPALRGYDLRCRRGMSALSSGFFSVVLEPTKMARVFCRAGSEGCVQSSGKSGCAGWVSEM